MAMTRIYLDEDALRRMMAISGVYTEQDAVNLALRFYTAHQGRIGHATPTDFDEPFQARPAQAS